jgi:hypothetical protein
MSALREPSGMKAAYFLRPRVTAPWTLSIDKAVSGRDKLRDRLAMV